MIKRLPIYLIFVLIVVHFPMVPLWGKIALPYSIKTTTSSIEEVLLIELTTTSTSSIWSPAKVTTGGEVLEWKASATGMVDQIVQTAGIPIFDLSVERSSAVTITVSTIDGKGNLTELIINSLNITTLNLFNTRYLTTLSCTDNQLTSLDLRNNDALTDLFCHSNQLKNLDITRNKYLTNLAFFSNQITEIDLSNNTLLSSLSCSNNLLQNLDLKNNSDLIALECDFNQLKSLNIQNGNNTLIQKIITENNQNLFCIQVDDVGYAEKNWINIDPWTAFNKDCTFTNESPVAIDDLYEVYENEILEIETSDGILSNDTDPDEDILMAVLQQNVIHGSLDLMEDGSFVYIPDPGYFGQETFTYMANDGEFNSNPAKVIIEVIMVNQAPVAVEDNYTTDENLSLNVDVINGVLSNDSDPDQDPLSAKLSSNTENGELVFLSDGSFSYVPDSGFYGADNFSYRAFDGYLYSDEAFVNINVNPVSAIMMPNAFTPNNDGLNDTFRPIYSGMDLVVLQVFDTWGNLVYQESGEVLKGWNGTINGKNAENGNYMYRVKAITNEFKEVKKEGLFSLIK